MPRRKLQFSLLTLFVIITLCAVGLGIWINKPPRVTRSGVGILNLGQDEIGKVRGIYLDDWKHLDSPIVNRNEAWEVCVLLPPGQRAMLGSAGTLPRASTCFNIIDEQGSSLRYHCIEVLILEEENFVVSGRQRLRLEKGKLYIVQIKEDWSSELTAIDLDDLDSLDIDPALREEIQKCHERTMGY